MLLFINVGPGQGKSGSYTTPPFPLYVSKLKCFLPLDFLFHIHYRMETENRDEILPVNLFSLLPNIIYKSSRTVDFFFLLLLIHSLLHAYFFTKH